MVLNGAVDMERFGALCLLLVINLLLSGCHKYDVDRDVLPPGTPYFRENNAASVWLYIYPDRIEKRLEGKVTDDRGLVVTQNCYIKAVNLSAERCVIWVENYEPEIKVFSGSESSAIKEGVSEKTVLLSGETRVFRMPMQSAFTIACQSDKGIKREHWTMKQIGGPLHTPLQQP